jgi:hypothetical protein
MFMQMLRKIKTSSPHLLDLCGVPVLNSLGVAGHSHCIISLSDIDSRCTIVHHAAKPLPMLPCRGFNRVDGGSELRFVTTGRRVAQVSYLFLTSVRANEDEIDTGDGTNLVHILDALFSLDLDHRDDSLVGGLHVFGCSESMADGGKS